MPSVPTRLADLINPQVMADMLPGKINSKIVVRPFAKIDNKLTGQPGDTITVPRYGYIGDAKDVAEGATVEAVKLTTSTSTLKIKKTMQEVLISDEAVLSAYGNPIGEVTDQLAASIASKVDIDAMTALQTASRKYTDAGILGYAGVVNAVDLFEEEWNSDKVMFIHPKQMTQLRLDPNFISADKYMGGVVVSGEVGRIANARIVMSRKVPLAGGTYACPIVKLNVDGETEDAVSALTIYVKREVLVETARLQSSQETKITASHYYTVGLTDDAKVVVAKFKATAG